MFQRYMIYVLLNYLASAWADFGEIALSGKKYLTHSQIHRASNIKLQI